MADKIGTIIDKGVLGTKIVANIGTKATSFDPRYLKTKYWKVNPAGSLENTWFRFYLDYGGVSIKEGANGESIPYTGDEISNIRSITVFGVSVSISKSPKLIQTSIKGFSNPIYQHFSQDSYDITVDFLESGPVFWQQNSKLINGLINILNTPQVINVSCPQLDLIYGIKKVVVTGYNIGQDPRFYSHNNISITLKSVAIQQDIIQRTNVI